MQSQLPIPTDNIYKFYALFGLLLLVTGVIGWTVLYKSTNERLLELFSKRIEISLEDEEDVKKAQKREQALELLEARIENVKESHYFFNSGLGFPLGIGFCMTAFGFWRWHRKVQPLQDELLSLQIEKARLEVEMFKQQESARWNDAR